jgi:hypothetical protein
MKADIQELKEMTDNQHNYDDDGADIPVNEKKKVEDTVRTFTEELEVAGNQLVGRIKELVEEGNVRRLIIKNVNDEVLLEIPLTIGAAIGGAIAIMTPVWAAVGALAALVIRVKIEIVREVDAE